MEIQAKQEAEMKGAGGGNIHLQVGWRWTTSI
jgi:hypothetical protein